MKNYRAALFVSVFCVLSTIFICACNLDDGIGVTDPQTTDYFNGKNYVVVSDAPNTVYNSIMLTGLGKEPYDIQWAAASSVYSNSDPSFSAPPQSISLTVDRIEFDETAYTVYRFTDHEVPISYGDSAITLTTYDIATPSVTLHSTTLNVYRQGLGFFDPVGLGNLLDQNEVTTYACACVAGDRALWDASQTKQWNELADPYHLCNSYFVPDSKIYAYTVDMSDPGIYQVVAQDGVENGLFVTTSYQRNYVHFVNLEENQEVVAYLLDNEFLLPADQFTMEIGFINPDETQAVTLHSTIARYSTSLTTDEQFLPVENVIVDHNGSTFFSAWLEDSEFSPWIEEDIALHVVLPSFSIISPTDNSWVEYEKNASVMVTAEVEHLDLETGGQYPDYIEFNGVTAEYNATTHIATAAIPLAFGDVTIEATLHLLSHGSTLTDSITVHHFPEINEPAIEITSPANGSWVEYKEGAYVMVTAEVERVELEEGDYVEINGATAAYSAETHIATAEIPLVYGYAPITAELKLVGRGYNYSDSVTVRNFPEVSMVFDPQFELCDPSNTSSTCFQRASETPLISGTKTFTTRVLEGRPSLTYLIDVPAYTYIETTTITSDILEACGTVVDIDPSTSTTTDICRTLKFYGNIKNSGINIVIQQEITYNGLNDTYRNNLLTIGNYLELGFVGAFPGTCNPFQPNNWCSANIPQYIEAVENAKDFSDTFTGFKPFIGVVTHDEGLWSAYTWLTQYWYSQIKQIDSSLIVFGVWDTGVYPGRNQNLAECISDYTTCPSEDITYPMIYISGGGADSNSLLGLQAAFKYWTDYKNPETGKSVNFMILHGTFAGLESYDSYSGNTPVCYSPVPHRRMPMEGTMEMADAMAKSEGAIGTAFWSWGDIYYYRDYGSYPAGTWRGFWYGQVEHPPCDPNDQGLFGLYDTKRWSETSPESRPEHYGMPEFNLYEDALYTTGYTTDELKQPGYGITTGISTTEHYLSAAAMDKTNREFNGIGIFKGRADSYPDPDTDGTGVDNKSYQWMIYSVSDATSEAHWRWVNDEANNCYADFKAQYVPRDGSTSETMLELSLNFFDYSDPLSTAETVSGIDLTARYQAASPGYAGIDGSCDYDSTCEDHIKACYNTYYKTFPNLSDQCVITGVTLTTSEQTIFSDLRTDVEDWLVVNFPPECVGMENNSFVQRKVIKQWPIGSNFPCIWEAGGSNLWDWWQPPEGKYVLNAETRADSFQGLELGTQWFYWLSDPLFSYLTVDPNVAWTSGSALIYIKNEGIPRLFILLPYWVNLPPGDTGRLWWWQQLQQRARDYNRPTATLDIDKLRLWSLDDAEVFPHEYATPEGATAPPHKYYFDPFRYYPGEIPEEQVGQPSGGITYDISNMSTSEFTLTGWYIPEISSKTYGGFAFAQLNGVDATAGGANNLKIGFINNGSCNPGLHDEQCPTVGNITILTHRPPGQQWGFYNLPVAFASGQPVFWALSLDSSYLHFVAGAYGSALEHIDIPIDFVQNYWNPSAFTNIIIGNTDDGLYPQEGYSSMVKGFNKSFTYQEIVEKFYKCGGEYSGCKFQ